MEKPKRKNMYFRSYEASQCSNQNDLIGMMKDSEPKVRAEVARNPFATQAIMMSALDDPDKTVRSAAASNKNATEDVLMKALNDEYFDVRWDASSNPAANHNVLKKALEMDDDAIRFRASGNESISVDLILIALEDKDAHVRQNAANSLLKLVKKKDEVFLLDLLSDNRWYSFTQMMADDPMLRMLVLAKLRKNGILLDKSV